MVASAGSLRRAILAGFELRVERAATALRGARYLPHSTSGSTRSLFVRRMGGLFDSEFEGCRLTSMTISDGCRVSSFQLMLPLPEMMVVLPATNAVCGMHWSSSSP